MNLIVKTIDVKSLFVILGLIIGELSKNSELLLLDEQVVDVLLEYSSLDDSELDEVVVLITA